jgi:hypothetical protein
MREFFAPVDVAAPLDEKGILAIVDRIHVGVRIVGVVNTAFCRQMGQWFLALKQNVAHGEWEAFCQRHFPDLPKSTRSYWMNKAKYYLQHGRDKSPTLGLLEVQGVGLLDEDLDEDEVGDLKKPAHRPREELEAELRRRNVQKAAWEKRDEAHQKEIDGLRRQVERLEKARDPDAVPDMNPIREAMVRAVLSAGRAVVVLREAETEDLVTELREGAIASLNSRLSTAAQDAANEIYKVFHKAFPGKPWKGPEPTDED